MIDPNLYTEEGAARVLAVKARTLRRYRTSGQIGHVRLPGGGVRYTVEQLLEFQRDNAKVATKLPLLAAQR
jgi:predicted site-specific integrase-resolvase